MDSEILAFVLLILETISVSLISASFFRNQKNFLGKVVLALNISIFTVYPFLHVEGKAAGSVPSTLPLEVRVAPRTSQNCSGASALRFDLYPVQVADPMG